MTKKLLTTLLALAAVLASAPGRAANARGSSEQGCPAEEVTPEEEHEARDLARQFVERLRENNDAAPLVEDLFVKDFGARLRHEREQLPMVFVAPEVAARATDEELRRFYIAEFNFFSRTLAYWMTRPDEEDEDDEDSSKPENLYPPEVMRVLRDDPIMSALIAREEAEQSAAEEPGQTAGEAAAGAASKAQGDEESDVVIKDLATLRAAIVTSGKAAEALRPYVPEFSALRRAQEANVPAEAFEEVHDPRLETYKENYFGFPPGTRFVELNVEPVHDIQYALILVREDGRLRILLAVPILGD